jgi:hypothetical protein
MPDGPAEVPAVEDAPFSAVREQAEAMRLLAQGHMNLRAAR